MVETPYLSAQDNALARLGKLIDVGLSPELIVHEVGAIIAGWANEPDMDAGVAQARIERLWDSLSKDAADLQERVVDVEGGDAQSLAQARRVLAAMNAAVMALAAAHERI